MVDRLLQQAFTLHFLLWTDINGERIIASISQAGIGNRIGVMRSTCGRWWAVQTTVLWSMPMICISLCKRTLHYRPNENKQTRQCFVCKFLSVCWCDSDDAEATSSTPNASCSPRWIVYPDMDALGAWREEAAKTQKQCFVACLANSSCVAVDWDDRSECWIYDKSGIGSLRRNDGTTHFEIVRRCNHSSNSSTWRAVTFHCPMLLLSFILKILISRKYIY